MISFNKALDILEKFKPKISTMIVDTLDSINMVLADDIKSDIDNPPFNNSKMDGYAVNYIDTIGASFESPVKLKVVDYIYAGNNSNIVLEKNTAIKIMTGAPIPNGATSVVKVEDTVTYESEVSILKEVSNGNYIRRQGEDFKLDEIILRKGTVLTPYEIGVLATLGKTCVKVIKKPVIAFFSTGDELIPVNQYPEKGQIRDSNSYLLMSFLKDMGIESVNLGTAIDDKKVIKDKLIEALQYDGVIITGGASVGDKDFVKSIVSEVGEVLFSKIAVKPGKPLTFGVTDNKPIFALPGNPVSAAIEFEMLVKPVILKMKGQHNLKRIEIKAYALNDYEVNDGRVHLLGTEVKLRNNKYFASFKKSIYSGRIGHTININGIIVVGENEKIKKEQVVTVHMLKKYIFIKDN